MHDARDARWCKTHVQAATGYPMVGSQRTYRYPLRVLVCSAGKPQAIFYPLVCRQTKSQDSPKTRGAGGVGVPQALDTPPATPASDTFRAVHLISCLAPTTSPSTMETQLDQVSRQSACVRCTTLSPRRIVGRRAVGQSDEPGRELCSTPVPPRPRACSLHLRRRQLFTVVSLQTATQIARTDIHTHRSSQVSGPSLPPW